MRQIFLLGDSTCAHKSDDKRPETGWGMALQPLVKKPWQILNLAQNGRSTKSFLDEGLFDCCLDQLTEGDWVFIQFGHNDSKEDEARHTDPWTTFQGNLLLMTDQVLARKAHPVLLTPICRRRFDERGNLVQTHGEYPMAILSLAESRGYAALDMTEKTFQLFNQLGPENSKMLFLHLKKGEHPNYPEGVADDTHLNEWGAQVIATLILSQLRDLYAFVPFLKD
ncbi:rhamnogalacturonan acetylesterase [Sphaerochaeta globosa]|uniref:Lipolytic protein G-D-S-L family n=1 Tax=Sphaerochaeta globosa (strain ATCC BAA-1886 / DSM 22777 / Buddy) TaxID=158189 RepID=F0RT39_SPHGB|nr:rhamnogalacturonan acetylesterase [Sphaerochaeta globosa]ADY14485.1 lipolytic protein G-D-S-L family [Sphaerochaeta globosa str. Buddy]